MRIYTEVIFEWDDKQNKLVETSSDSFEYSGDMMLMQGGGYDTYYIDTTGDGAYDVKIQYDSSTGEINSVSRGGTTISRQKAHSTNKEAMNKQIRAITEDLSSREYVVNGVAASYASDAEGANFGVATSAITTESVDYSFIPEAANEQEAIELYAEEHHGWEPGTSLSTVGKTWNQMRAELKAAGWREYRGLVYEVDGNKYTDEEMEGLYGEDFNPDDYKMIEGGNWVKKSKLELLDKPPRWDPDEPLSFEEMLEADTPPEDIYSENWLTWMEYRQDTHGDANEFYAGFTEKRWVRDDEREGYFIGEGGEEVVEEERMYQTADGRIHTEKWMREHPEIDAEGNVIPFDPDDWKLAEGGAYIKRGEEKPIGYGAQQSALIIESAIADWMKITKPGEADPFQDKIEDAIDDLGIAEEDVVRAFKDLEDPGEELETLKEDWELEMTRLMGTTYTDEDGNVYTAAEALDQGLITQEEFEEMEGSYLADIRTTGEEKEEGLEEIVLSREEGLEALREEARGEIRTAEAKIGAAGFAATGVGKSARDVLAEEIGKEARDIEEVFVEERGDIQTGYTKDIVGIEKKKTDAITDYKRERDRLAKAALKPWETESIEYERLLKEFGAVEGEEGDYTLESVTGGKEVEAEEALMDVQTELSNMIQVLRSSGEPGMADYDPFTDPETRLSGLTGTEGVGWADIFGWSPITKTFTSGVTEGLFRETIETKVYKPGEEFESTGLYDPTHKFPWEEEGYVPPWEKGG
tara:strand:+ start:5397 stop:7655 length:2259 start_codon:yes stop_codon:yes gene_type:complete